MGWVCFGVLPKDYLLATNALPDVTSMANTIGACTDANG